MKKGFGQFCPIAVACEVFAERWTPLILRELLGGVDQFNEIHRGIPLISRPLLVRRLRELEAAGVITMEPAPRGRGHRYRLTQAGQEFRSILEGLATWGQRWTIRVDRKNMDASVLMWNIRRRIALDRLSPGRTVIRFKFRGTAQTYRGPRTFWLLLEQPQAEVCIEDPGLDVDLYVQADVAGLAKVWLGDASFETVLRSKQVELVGSPEIVRLFPTLLMLSRFAAVPRPGGTVAGNQPALNEASRLTAAG